VQNGNHKNPTKSNKAEYFVHRASPNIPPSWRPLRAVGSFEKRRRRWRISNVKKAKAVSTVATELCALKLGSNEMPIRASADPMYHATPYHPLPGINTFRVQDLNSSFSQWLIERTKPIGHIEHTFLIYDISRALFTEYLDAFRKLYSDSSSKNDCLAGTKIPFIDAPFSWRSRDVMGKEITVCIQINKLTYLGLALTQGRVELTSHIHDRREHFEILKGKQELWFSLEPAIHAIKIRSRIGFDGKWVSLGPLPPIYTSKHLEIEPLDNSLGQS